MSGVTTFTLNEEEALRLSKDELVVVVLDWLQRMKDIGAMLRREDALEKQLNEAQEEIGHLKKNMDSLTVKLTKSRRHIKNLENQTIPMLKREIENQRSHRNKLRLENQKYHKRVMEQETSLENLERKSRLELRKILVEKDAVEYRSEADLKIIDQREDEIRRLEFELSRKLDDIGILKKEVSHHKDRCTRLEGKTDELERKLEREEKEKKDILKNLPKPKKEDIIFTTKKEFQVGLQICEPILIEEKMKRKRLINHLKKMEGEKTNLLKKQAESNAELSALQRQVAALNMTEKKCFAHPESDWRKLKEEIKALNGQVETLMENKQRDREYTDKLVEKMHKLKDNYYMAKMKEEDLQIKYDDLKKAYEHLKKEYDDLTQSKIKEDKTDVAVESPASQIKAERQTDNKVIFLPPIDKRSIRYQTLPLGEGKLVPNFKEDKLMTEEKMNQLKPTPPGTKKPEVSSTSAGRKRSLKTEQRKDGGKPGRAPQ
ncbi:myosin-10-like [Gambusia affinis]|uniref:myosin-10-like n=1 Tax=Gambusia affinis TaxID=33528 RepID=UPI001CDCE57F|nr:myosin-10-like [Gambusia affinis]